MKHAYRSTDQCNIYIALGQNQTYYFITGLYYRRSSIIIEEQMDDHQTLQRDETMLKKNVQRRVKTNTAMLELEMQHIGIICKIYVLNSINNQYIIKN